MEAPPRPTAGRFSLCSRSFSSRLSCFLALVLARRRTRPPPPPMMRTEAQLAAALAVPPAVDELSAAVYIFWL